MKRSPVVPFACVVFAGSLLAQTSPMVVKPKPFDGVLVNPGIGFTTFQRFNGDSLNTGTRWTEGFPIEYQPFRGTLENKDFPRTTIAYFRVYWKFLEPEMGVYRWDMLDKALVTARERGQTLMLRIAPYGSNPDTDVPDWYRRLTGEKPGGAKPTTSKWMVDPMNPAYARYFGETIRALGERYDGDPDLELVDVSIVGAWGEGAGADLLTDSVRKALMDSYLDSFHKTPLVVQPTDRETVAYALSRAHVGWRADCLGDMGGFSPTWNHMTDYYPEAIAEYGLEDAWKKAPVTMEACWVMQSWKDRGWDVDYIIDQAIKWHVSSFNAKSSPVPEEWRPEVDRWLKHMGYRFALRRFTYPALVGPNRKLDFTSWWENQGDAPCYRRFPLALRLKNDRASAVMVTGADIRGWMPGDNVYNSAVFVPATLPDGDYSIAVALVDPQTRLPKVNLAIEGVAPDGWYTLGAVKLSSRPERSEVEGPAVP